MKHVQNWEQDPRNDRLVRGLWDERRHDAPTADDHRRLRRQAEEILGEESVFRLDWVRRLVHDADGC